MRTETSVFEDGSRTVYIYDGVGNQIRTTDYDSDSSIVFDIYYDNNELGDVTGWKVYNHEGVIFRYFEVDYLSRGVESELREYGEDGSLIKREQYFYDSEGRRIETYYYDSQGVLRGKAMDEYDESSKYVETKYFDNEGNSLSCPAA
jgi:uncharacterized protein RhaS with RHS repeats